MAAVAPWRGEGLFTFQAPLTFQAPQCRERGPPLAVSGAFSLFRPWLAVSLTSPCRQCRECDLPMPVSM